MPGHFHCPGISPKGIEIFRHSLQTRRKISATVRAKKSSCGESGDLDYMSVAGKGLSAKLWEHIENIRAFRNYKKG